MVNKTAHHRAEERLEVVGQLRTASIPGVHRDEHVARVAQRQVRALELEPLELGGLGTHDGEDLLGDDAKHLSKGLVRDSQGFSRCRLAVHLEVDAVELIEARPRARGGQPLKELGHGEVVQAVRAVEHHALHRNRLGQILQS
eukprot:5593186-Pyramimonas_sp.AAC.1